MELTSVSVNSIDAGVGADLSVYLTVFLLNCIGPRSTFHQDPLITHKHPETHIFKGALLHGRPIFFPSIFIFVFQCISVNLSIHRC